MKSSKFGLTVALSFILFGCRGQKCEIKGTWIAKYGRIARNYEMAEPYTRNRIAFSGDSIDVASGFFYNTLDANDDYPTGAYSYIYYGSGEKYKIQNDSLYIYSKPYDKWNSFKIACTGDDEMLLIGVGDTLILERHRESIDETECSIECVSVQVRDGDLSLFQNNYKATYSSDDRLVFSGVDSSGKFLQDTVLDLETGTFKKICRGFDYIEMDQVLNVYKTEVSEVNAIFLEIRMNDGRIVKSEIQNMACPDDLRLALVPVLYTHQLYIYAKLPPAK